MYLGCKFGVLVRGKSLYCTLYSVLLEQRACKELSNWSEINGMEKNIPLSQVNQSTSRTVRSIDKGRDGCRDVSRGGEE